MKKQVPKKITRAEAEYVRAMSRESAFEKLDRGKAKVLRPEEYPQALRRFLKREQSTVRIELTAGARRRLKLLSRARGVPPDELARRWVEDGLAREAG
jgi:hypothetical protein